jgi:hypothetical protein
MPEYNVFILNKLSIVELYKGASTSFQTESITKYMLMITLVEKQYKRLWWQNSLD